MRLMSLLCDLETHHAKPEQRRVLLEFFPRCCRADREEVIANRDQQTKRFDVAERSVPLHGLQVRASAIHRSPAGLKLLVFGEEGPELFEFDGDLCLTALLAGHRDLSVRFAASEHDDSVAAGR